MPGLSIIMVSSSYKFDVILIAVPFPASLTACYIFSLIPAALACTLSFYPPITLSTISFLGIGPSLVSLTAFYIILNIYI